MEQSTQTLVCAAGRKPMSRDDKVRHMTNCRHPQCVRLLAFYDRVREYVKQNLNDKEIK